MEIEDVELRRLADNLGFEWQKLATYLGFKRAKIQQLELEIEHQSVGNIIFNMLVSWRERQPKEINVRQAMKEALEKCERVDLAESIAPESARAILDKIYFVLKSKLENNPDKFHDAIIAFYKGIVVRTNDCQLSSALTDFGKCSGVEKANVDIEEEKRLATEKEKQTCKRWQPVMRITETGMQGETFGKALGIVLHPSGDIAVIDSGSRSSDDSKMYCFGADGICKFILTSTGPEQNPAGKFPKAESIGVTQDGHYIVPEEKNRLKVFDMDGKYVDSFKTTTKCPSGFAIGSNGHILIGDSSRNLVTVHNGTDFSIEREVYVSLNPGKIAVNSQEVIVVSDWVAGKVVAFDYFGDEVFTIEPKIWGESARPMGLHCDTNDNLLIAVSKWYMPCDWLINPLRNSGHIHYYNKRGDFLKCILKGLHEPHDMSMRNDMLGIANGDHVQIYKAI